MMDETTLCLATAVVNMEPPIRGETLYEQVGESLMNQIEEQFLRNLAECEHKSGYVSFQLAVHYNIPTQE
jgi:hypothetical protein